MQPQNLLIILSDEHNPQFLGIAGHPFVRTPNLDRLARRGARFTRATTPSPICVPARAALATGRYVHSIGAWDNAHPYDGRAIGWAHRLTQRGHDVTAIGKLHYRSDQDEYGFTQSLHTMQVLDGMGDRIGLLRRQPIVRSALSRHAEIAGPGESTYADFDRQVAALGCEWIEGKANGRVETPWVLQVGFVLPHYPYVAPQPFYDLYADMPLPEPRLYASEQRPSHPWLRRLSAMLPYDAKFDHQRRKAAITAYHGMVSLLDHHIGMLLDTLRTTGLEERTRVLYTSDHGEMLGNHGMWGKCCMYEESVGIPLIFAGAEIEPASIVATEASLVDCHPTILDAVGAPPDPGEPPRPGSSLFQLLNQVDDARVGFSEYHAVGSDSGCFMVRAGRWKYVHYVGMAPQLFDLVGDPGESLDLGTNTAYASIRRRLEAALRKIVDPEQASEAALASQDEKVREQGGAGRILAEAEDFPYTPAPTAEEAGSPADVCPS
jgi:choline-sulfatase